MPLFSQRERMQILVDVVGKEGAHALTCLKMRHVVLALTAYKQIGYVTLEKI